MIEQAMSLIKLCPHIQTPVACGLSKRVLESYNAISVSWLASAAFLEELQQSVTVLLGLKTQAVNATDEAYSVMRVAVHINGWYREAKLKNDVLSACCWLETENCTGREKEVGWKSWN